MKILYIVMKSIENKKVSDCIITHTGGVNNMT